MTNSCNILHKIRCGNREVYDRLGRRMYPTFDDPRAPGEQQPPGVFVCSIIALGNADRCRAPDRAVKGR
jgi:hypothetical protein